MEPGQAVQKPLQEPRQLLVSLDLRGGHGRAADEFKIYFKSIARTWGSGGRER